MGSNPTFPTYTLVVELAYTTDQKSVAFWIKGSTPFKSTTKLSVMDRKITADELKWQAEDDARIIERYNEIINDKPRLERAMKAAKKQVENLTERANALNRSITGIKKRK